MAGRKSDSLLKTAVRKMLQRYLKDNDISIKSGTDVNSVMRKLMSVLLEGTFDVELNEEPRYSKYDCRNKETGEYCYLLDRLMGLELHAHISEDAEARILEEAVESNYRKGGINAYIGEQEVSKETVTNKLHTLEFPLPEPLKEKRRVSRLYIDADEDHVSLQYLEKKGDIKKPRVNTVMPKLIYVYEDVNFDGSKHELVNCHYFGGDYAGTEGTKELWQEVFDFIAENYDEDVLEKIYINGDGADWIRTGAGMHAKARFVLDRFHMHKYTISDILELVRYQKKELPLAAGAEEVIYSATQMLAAERRNKNRLGKLADMPVYSIPYPQIKKIAALKNHIWGL